MESKEIKISEHRTKKLTLYTIGPTFEEKAKSALYFSLSGFDSLMTSPFCTPATLLAQKGYRVISVTLPGHEGNEKPMNIREIWGENPTLITDFLEKLEASVDEIKHHCVGKISALGLSRGALIATHLAARMDAIDSVVGYAPLTFLEDIPSMDIIHLADRLKEKKIRYSIGHNDTLVNTERVRNVVNKLIEPLGTRGRQESYISLSIYPSIGKDGHGTPPTTFQESITWLLQRRGDDT